MHWFQFPHIQEMTSLTFTSFIWQCYSFSVYSVLFIILKIFFFACVNKDVLWWILRYLVLWIGGLENERFLTFFYRWKIHTYIHLLKEWKILFCRQGKSNHQKSLNLLCNYTIWLFTAFAQINTSNIQWIICVDTLLGNGISLSILTEKNTNRSISKQAYRNLYWVFLSRWHNLFNYL